MTTSRRANQLLIARAFVDGCPEESHSRKDNDRHRWHTVAWIFGKKEELFREIEPLMRKRSRHFNKMRQWKDSGNGYKRAIKEHLLPVLGELKFVVVAWSYRESTVSIVLPKLLRDFDISPLAYVSYRDAFGKQRVRFENQGILPSPLSNSIPLLETQVLPILMIADSIASSYRQFEEGMFKYHPDELLRFWHLYTDPISGDRHSIDSVLGFKIDERRRLLLEWLLHLRFPGRQTIHYDNQQSFPIGEMLADNMAGTLNSVIEDRESPESLQFWDGYDSNILQWRATLPSFEAQRQSDPRTVV